MEDKIIRAKDIIKTSRSLFVLTGAGISAESGIPTFRGKDGLWKNYSAMDLATPEAFARNPGLVWEWYHWRQHLILNARPNQAHVAVVALEKKMKKFLLLTQNVDNLHARAGSQRVLELHGNIFRTRCLECSRIANYKSSAKEREIIPKCECGGILRPDVVWFGEPIPQKIWNTALQYIDSADAVLICGTSGSVWPAAAIPAIARQNGVKTIEVNLDPTSISEIVDVAIKGKAGEILPQFITY